MKTFNLFVKRLIDIVGSGLGLILISPFLFIVMILIKLMMPGPIFFKQERVGKNKKLFYILKFRTMLLDKEAEKNLDFSKDKERLTSLGKILRRLKIDELPQLINVFIGQMSLVGPRPTVMKQVEKYTENQMKRLNMSPGMTGLAQVNGNISLPWEQRIQYDSEYINKFSIILDLKILLKTVAIVIFGEQKFKKKKVVIINKIETINNCVRRINMKSILIGSVSSSKEILEEMIKINFPLDMVFSLDEQYSENVSGYYPIHVIAEKKGIPWRKFKKINDIDNIIEIKKIKPDYIFVIGLSQLVSKDIIQSAKKGVIGFHPTPLPKFRGRAAMVWQVLLGVHETKCSLFFIDEGIDSGDIIGQEEYVIEDTDYALDVSEKCREAFKRLLKRVLPQLIDGSIKSVKQNEEEAIYLLKRTPEDGLINWDEPIEKIQRLIRAVSKPYPGAFSNYNDKHKVIFWRADCMKNKKYIGILGQIAKRTGDYIDIVCIDGLLRVYDYENVDNIRLIEGHKFK